MAIFSGSQGQVTPQSMVGSGRISNLSETLWLSSLHANMKNIRSKMKVLECWFFRRSRAGNSVVSGRIWAKLELICTLTVVLITCKNEEDLINNEGARVLTTFSPV